MQLVFVEEERQEPCTLSSIVAECAETKHETVQRLIRKRETDLEEFGKVGFEIRPSKSGQKEKHFMLNEQQATLLITFMRNTEPVIQFKKALVKAFYDMRMELEQEHKKPKHPYAGVNSLRTFGKQYGSVIELIEDTRTLQVHDDPFQLPDLMHDRTVTLIVKLLDFYRFPMMPSFREIRTMIHFIRLYHLGEFVKKLNYCFENNKLNIPYLMVSLENNTVTSNRGLLNQLEILEKYLN